MASAVEEMKVLPGSQEKDQLLPSQPDYVSWLERYNGDLNKLLRPVLYADVVRLIRGYALPPIHRALQVAGTTAEYNRALSVYQDLALTKIRVWLVYVSGGLCETVFIRDLTPLVRYWGRSLETLIIETYSDEKIDAERLPIVLTQFPNLKQLGLCQMEFMTEALLQSILAAVGPRLTHLELTGTQDTSKALIAEAKSLTNLESIVLDDVNLTASSVTVLLKHCPRLHTLRSHIAEFLEDDILSPLARFKPQLRELSLDDGGFSDGALWPAVSHCSALQTVRFSGLTPQHLLQLVQQNPRLTTLYLGWGIEPALAEQIVLAAPQLQVLPGGLSSTELVDAVPRLSCLQEAHLYNYGSFDVSEEQVTRIVQNCHDLRLITLPATSTKALICVAQQCRKLRSLTLPCHAEVTDEAVCAVAQNCPRLVELCFTEHTNAMPHCTERSMLALAHGCPDLKRLEAPPQLLTERAMREILERCPQLRSIQCESAQWNDELCLHLQRRCTLPFRASKRHICVLCRMPQAIGTVPCRHPIIGLPICNKCVDLKELRSRKMQVQWCYGIAAPAADARNDSGSGGISSPAIAARSAVHCASPQSKCFWCFHRLIQGYRSTCYEVTQLQCCRCTRVVCSDCVFQYWPSEEYERMQSESKGGSWVCFVCDRKPLEILWGDALQWPPPPLPPRSALLSVPELAALHAARWNDCLPFGAREIPAELVGHILSFLYVEEHVLLSCVDQAMRFQLCWHPKTWRWGLHFRTRDFTSPSLPQIMDEFGQRHCDVMGVNLIADAGACNWNGLPMETLDYVCVFPALRVLRFQCCDSLTDVTALTCCMELQHLNLNHSTHLADITVLSRMTSLQCLHLCHTQVASVEPLSCLSALRELHVADAPVAHIQPLSSLTALQVLNLQSTRVTQVLPTLTRLLALRELDLSALKLDLKGTRVALTTALSALQVLRLEDE